MITLTVNSWLHCITSRYDIRIFPITSLERNQHNTAAPPVSCCHRQDEFIPRSPTSPVSEEDLLLSVCVLIEKYHPGPDKNLMAKGEPFCTCKPSPGVIIWKIMELQVVASGLLIHIIVNSRIMWNFADLTLVHPQMALCKYWQWTEAPSRSQPPRNPLYTLSTLPVASCLS